MCHRGLITAVFYVFAGVLAETLVNSTNCISHLDASESQHRRQILKRIRIFPEIEVEAM